MGMSIEYPETPGFNNNDANKLPFAGVEPNDWVIIVKADGTGTFRGKASALVTGSGGGGLSSGAGDPTEAPTHPEVDNLYRNTTSKSLWWWPAGGSAWEQET